MGIAELARWLLDCRRRRQLAASLGADRLGHPDVRAQHAKRNPGLAHGRHL